MAVEGLLRWETVEPVEKAKERVGESCKPMMKMSCSIRQKPVHGEISCPWI
jgi:hypothetical protein